MPAGAVGDVWADGSWEDTAWEAGVWGEAGEPTEPGEPINNVYVTGSIYTDITVTGEI